MTSREQLNKEINDLWQKHLPLMRSRIETIQLAVDALRKSRLTQDLRAEAAREAHNLAGSLGTFGLQSGSDAAAEIEGLLSSRDALSDVELDRIKQLLERLSDDADRRLPT